MLKQLDVVQDTLIQHKQKDKSNIKNVDSPKKSEATVKTGMFKFNSFIVQIDTVIYKFDMIEHLQRWSLIRTESIVMV